MLYKVSRKKSSDFTAKFYYLSTVPLSASLMKFPSSRSNAKPLQLKQKSLITNQFIDSANLRNNNLYFQKVTMLKRDSSTHMNDMLVKQIKIAKNPKIKYHPQSKGGKLKRREIMRETERERV